MIKRVLSIGGMSAICLLILMMTGALAATLPEAVKLLEIGPLSRPTKVTADSAGNIYIGESNAKMVSKYSSSGGLISHIDILPSKATALKAADNGLLYVGQKSKISVYSGQSLVNTISGVSLPSAIDVTSAGIIYVLDADAYNVVKIDAGGSKTVVADSGVLGTDLRDLVIDEANNEFYVLDRGAAYVDAGGATIYVLRVLVFDLTTGAKLRSFSSYGYGVEGALGSASSIAVDGQRRIYVADNAQNIIGVFDHLGTYLGTLYNNSDVYYNPVNIDFRNDRLYFVSFLGDKATVLGIDGFANLNIQPASVSVDVQGTRVIGNRTVTMQNAGRGDLNWSASSDAAWLSFGASGSIGAGLSEAADVLVDTSKLVAGQNTGTVTVNSNGGSAVISVTANVKDLPELYVTPSAADMQAAVGGTPAPQQATVEIRNDLSNGLTWQSSSDSAWLSLSPATGPSNVITNANINVDTKGLKTGVYTGILTITAEGAKNSPASIKVTLTLAGTSSIQISTNNSSATFTLAGAQTYSGSGTNWTVTDVAPGEYTVTYDPISGYKTPASARQTVAAGGTVSFSGTYVQINPEDIVATLGGKKDPTTVTILDAAGSVKNVFTAFRGMSGGLNTAVGDFNGDGKNEIVAGLQNGQSLVGIFKSDGTLIKKFRAFEDNDRTSRGVTVYAADLDGDGTAEIVAVKNAAKAEIKVLGFAAGKVFDTGIDFIASSSGEEVFAAVGDADGDGGKEIVTVSGTIMNTWKIDTTAGPGKWTVAAGGETAVNAGCAGIVVRDIDGDGKDDIILAFSSGSLTVLRGDGSTASVKLMASGVGDMAAGDVNADGNREIVTGLGDGRLQISETDGTEIHTITISNRITGVRISTGDLGYQGVSK